jgi:glycosyltransferase involved in cell wall biosynthesis
MAPPPYRLAYLVTHPIQYQAPLLRLIASQPDIELTVFFESDFSVRGYRDAGFDQVIKWDVPLLDGYDHEFLPAIGGRDRISGGRPFSYGLFSRLRRERFDALWVHGYARRTNLLAILAARLAGIKIFVRDEATALSAPRSPLKRALKAIFFRLLSGSVTGFLSIGTANRDYYIANGIAAGRIFPVPYAVDNAFFADRAAQAEPGRTAFRARLGLETGRAVILYASKFLPRKRADDLLHAYERLLETLPDNAVPPYLLFVGDGELRARVEAEAQAKGLGAVLFLGFRNQTELAAFYDLCDVFVLPSIHEPWGLVVNEVMAAGRPVIVGDEVGCAADLVQPGRNGFTIRAGDVEALAQALYRIVTADPDARRRMNATSREIIAGWSFAEDVAGLRQALRAALSG